MITTYQPIARAQLLYLTTPVLRSSLGLLRCTGNNVQLFEV